MNLDETDHAILQILRENARLSNREVARRLDIPESRVRLRIKKLLDEEYMRFSLIMQPSVSGYRLSAYVRFSVDAKNCREAAAYLCAQESVIYVSLITGTYNILAVFLARSNQDLYDQVNGSWREKFHVARADVRLFFNAAKHRYDLMRLPDSD